LRRIAPLLLIGLTGCPLLSVEAEIPEACLTYTDVEVVGVPAGVPFTYTKTLEEIPLADGFVSLDAVVTDARASLRAKSGIANFAFVDGLVVTIASADPSLPPFDLVACQGGSCASATGTTTIAAQTPENLIDYMTAGPAAVTITLTGTLPTEAWTTDIEICLGGKARLTLEP
jgi:hypothetical protein